MSRVHCFVGFDENGKLFLQDRGSLNGTFVENRKVNLTELESGSEVFFGRKGLVRLIVEEKETSTAVGEKSNKKRNANVSPQVGYAKAKLPSSETKRTVLAGSSEKYSRISHIEMSFIDLKRNETTIGRSKFNDFILDHPLVSRFHAKFVKDGNRVLLYDLKSANGTFVNGERISQVEIREGDRITIGPFTYFMASSGRLEVSDFHERLKFVANRIYKKVKGDDGEAEKVLLTDISLVAGQGELVGIIGPSGCGKTTLLNILSGHDRKIEGDVIINGQSLIEHCDEFRGNIGFVPQDDIVHTALTPYRCLYYTSKLRFPPDTTQEEVEMQVSHVLDELKISDVKDIKIGDPVKKGISGGQRKRVNMGQELLTEPRILLLDEPTSGLDPKTERDVMVLLRKMASDGRLVFLTTHNINRHNFEIMDKVAILHKGHLVYYGPGKEASSYFGVEDPIDIFTKIEESTAEEWEKHFKKSLLYKKLIEDVEDAKTHETEKKQKIRKHDTKRPAGFKQFVTLTKRCIEIKCRDTLQTAVLLLQAPIIAIILGLVFRNNLNDPGEGPSMRMNFLFISSLATLWFGASSAVREIVSERAIYMRERAVILKIPSYIFSKVAVFSAIALIQCLLLSSISISLLSQEGRMLILDPPPRFGYYNLILFLTAESGVGIGLILSSMVNSSEGAIGLVPVFLLPQIIFGGAVFPLAKLGNLEFISHLMVSKWSLFAMMENLPSASRVDVLNVLCRGMKKEAVGPFPALWTDLIILVIFGGSLIALTGILLWLREKKRK